MANRLFRDIGAGTEEFSFCDLQEFAAGGATRKDDGGEEGRIV
jgi:hypothetical protein